MSVRHLFKKQTNKFNIIFTINNNFVDVFVSTSINFEYFVKVSGNWCEMGRSSCTVHVPDLIVSIGSCFCVTL